MRLRWVAAAGLTIVMLGAACDPLTGTGPGTPPNLKDYMHVFPASRSVVFTLIAGYPAGDIQFNYDGYTNGTLVITVPTGWQATVQCENHGTVPNSCAVVKGRGETSPSEAGGSTPVPGAGGAPGQCGAFEMSPSHPRRSPIATLASA